MSTALAPGHEPGSARWRAPWWTTGEAVLLARRVLRECGYDERRALLELPHWAGQRGHELDEADAIVLVIVAEDQEDTVHVAEALWASEGQRARRAA